MASVLACVLASAVSLPREAGAPGAPVKLAGEDLLLVQLTPDQVRELVPGAVGQLPWWLSVLDGENLASTVRRIDQDENWARYVVYDPRWPVNQPSVTVTSEAFLVLPPDADPSTRRIVCLVADVRDNRWPDALAGPELRWLRLGLELSPAEWCMAR